MTKLSRQYVAGFIDGEGYIALSHRFEHNSSGTYGTWSSWVTITNTKPLILHLIQNKYGGFMYKRIPDPTKNHKPAYQLIFVKKTARNLLKSILPYLILKKRQAELLLTLDFNNDARRRGIPKDEIKKRKRVLREIKKLNRLGRWSNKELKRRNIKYPHSK